MLLSLNTDECPWSFHKPTRYCLLLKGETLTPYTNAASFCSSKGARMVNIMTEAKNTVITSIGSYASREL